MAEQNRAKDLALLLPFAGGFLMLPSVLTFFNSGDSFFGIPLVPLYLFGLWILLIVFSALISRRLVVRKEHQDERQTPVDRSKPDGV